MITAVLFDADDTLWDFGTSMRAALQATLEELWTSHPGRPAASLTVNQLIATRDRVAAELEGRVLDLAVIRLFAFQRSLEEAGIPEPGLADELAATYFSHRAHLVGLFDDTVEALDGLSDRRLAIVSNGVAEAERFGIASYFETVVRSIDVGCSKPDPAIIHIALERIGVAGSEAILVGDSEAYDVVAAQRAGIRSVLVNRSGGPVVSEANWVISSLADLPALVRRDG